MVAEKLVQLERPDVILEPAREPFVKVGAPRFRQRLVGGVPHEQVAEAEAVLARHLCPFGCDQLLAHQSGQLRRHLGLVVDERLDGAAVEDLALDRRALEHRALAALEGVEACREQRLERRRDDRLAVFRHREHLADEERVASGGPRNLLT